MGVLKKIISGKTVHYSIGAIIKKGEKILLIDRAIPPSGFACPAGHVDEGESSEEALKREIMEETSLKVTDCELVFQGMLKNNWCNKGATQHQWKVFACKVKGRVKKNDESKSIGWYTPEEIRKLDLESSWTFLFKSIGII